MTRQLTEAQLEVKRHNCESMINNILSQLYGYSQRDVEIEVVGPRPLSHRPYSKVKLAFKEQAE